MPACHVVRSLRRLSTALFALVVAAEASGAPSLTLPEALRIAESNAPSVAAAEAAARAAREASVAASQLPDPVLRAGVDNVPLNGPDAFSLTRDFMTMRRIGVMQEYVSTDKRATRRQRGETEALRFDAEAAMSRAELRTDIAASWYARLYGRRTERVLQALADEIAMQARAAAAQVASGRTTAADVLATRAMLVQAQDRVVAARRQQDVAAARLARWLGPEAVRLPEEHFEAPDDAAIAALEPHDVHVIPHLAVLAREVDVAEAEIDVARRDRSPNWSWEVAYAHRGPSYSNMVSVGVSVPLPIARAHRQDRDVAARIAQRDRARALLEDARRRHQAEFDAMRVELQALRERQRELDTTLLPLTRQRTEAQLAAYRGGQQSLAGVLEARRAEVDARLQSLDLERDAALVWARLRYTYLDTTVSPASIRQGERP